MGAGRRMNGGRAQDEWGQGAGWKCRLKYRPKRNVGQKCRSRHKTQDIRRR
jgi:hypothetical protein